MHKGDRMHSRSPARATPQSSAPFHRGALLLLSLGLMACGQHTSTLPSVSASTDLHLEAENGTIEAAVAPQAVAEPISGGRIIQDPAASGGRAVILLGTNDAVRFKLPSNFTPGRYTVKVQGRGEPYQGWPTVALENDGRKRMSVTTLDTKTYALRGFGEFDLRPNQEMSVAFLNDRYDGPGKDRNAVVDSLVIEPVKATPTPPAGPTSFVSLFGTSGGDSANDVAVDASGNSYVVGQTYGTFPGQTKTGDADAYVRKVDPHGKELWTRQFGPAAVPNAASPSLADLHSVRIDARGNVYVAGTVYGSGNLPGQTSAGGRDVFVRKYTSDGILIWTQQFGTARDELPTSLGVDARGNVYVVGQTNGLLPGQEGYDGPPLSESTISFVRKYTPDGAVGWTRQFANITPSSQSEPPRALSYTRGAAVDPAGNIYVAGVTYLPFPGQTQVGNGFNAFVRKYRTDGGLLWTRQLGTPPSTPAPGGSGDSTDGSDIAVDALGNSYLTGSTVRLGTEPGTLVGPNRTGSGPRYLSKYSPEGTPLWIRQFGPVERAQEQGKQWVGVDGAGNAVVVGDKELTFPGQPAVVERFVQKYSPDGRVLAARALEQMGWSSVSYRAASVDLKGSVSLVGDFEELYPKQTPNGGRDAFLIKLTP